MGHLARTLTASIAVLAATLVVVSNAAAFPSVVRVETRDMNSIASGAFVNRVAVDTPGPVTITDAGDATVSTTCAAASPVAAVVAAVGAAQVKTIKDPTTGQWLISSIKGATQPTTITAPAVNPQWFWRVYVDQGPVDNGAYNFNQQESCGGPDVPAGSEVLVYKACANTTISSTACYSGTPLYLRVRQGGAYDIAAQTVPGRGAPVVVRAIADKTPATALFGTDEGVTATSSATGENPGETGVSFTNPGPHSIIVVASNGTRPPGRMSVCVSEGNDGFCGSTRYQPPPDIVYPPSPCATNGHDGLCGTLDTSGPITHVTNIINKKVFKRKKGPGQVAGTIDTDPNGVQDVKLRLTRVVTAKVKVKAKRTKSRKKPKARYRTVKRCTAWNDTTALLQSTKCGTKYAKWFATDLSDLRDKFTYSFAMTLPAGTYTLEVLAADENGSKDAPAAGRNVLTFTVL
ncbi:MAG: hypothetical protein JWQ18_3013 [Conexibacter sp.]|nr:hypothetical protein [Conexibacter sp.]